jgi:hypothetical protein
MSKKVNSRSSILIETQLDRLSTCQYSTWRLSELFLLVFKIGLQQGWGWIDRGEASKLGNELSIYLSQTSKEFQRLGWLLPPFSDGKAIRIRKINELLA